MNLWCPQFSPKTNVGIILCTENYPNVRFLGELRTPLIAFGIYWPLLRILELLWLALILKLPLKGHKYLFQWYCTHSRQMQFCIWCIGMNGMSKNAINKKHLQLFAQNIIILWQRWIKSSSLVEAINFWPSVRKNSES